MRFTSNETQESVSQSSLKIGQAINMQIKIYYGLLSIPR